MFGRMESGSTTDVRKGRSVSGGGRRTCRGAAALALAAMTIAASTAAAEGSAVECVGYQDAGHAPGTAHLVVSNPGTAGLGFEVRFLDLDRTVLATESFTLEGGASIDLDTASRNAGYAEQVLSAGELSVESYVISACDGGERRAIACAGPGAKA